MHTDSTTDASGSEDEPETSPLPVNEDALRVLVTRLARPHRSGGRAIERASLLSSGTDFSAAVAWIEAHGGEPELAAASRSSGGLHSARHGTVSSEPLRYVLPRGALG